MSAMGRYVYEMEEDAREMSFDAFVLKYGRYNKDVWEQIHLDSPSCWDKYIPEYDEYDYESMADN
jgi:hypothetical protein